MRMSSVAMMTSERLFAVWQRSQTCWRSGLPRMGKSGLPGNRVDAQRAGMIAAAFMFLSRRMIWAASTMSLRDKSAPQITVVPAVAGQDKDRSAAGVSAAENIAVLVADEPRFFDRDPMIALSFLDHPGARFPTGGRA